MHTHRFKIDFGVPRYDVHCCSQCGASLLCNCYVVVHVLQVLPITGHRVQCMKVADGAVVLGYQFGYDALPYYACIHFLAPFLVWFRTNSPHPPPAQLSVQSPGLLHGGKLAGGLFKFSIQRRPAVTILPTGLESFHNPAETIRMDPHRDDRSRHSAATPALSLTHRPISGRRY